MLFYEPPPGYVVMHAVASEVPRLMVSVVIHWWMTDLLSQYVLVS